MANQIPDTQVYFLSNGDNWGNFYVSDNSYLVSGALGILVANGVPNKLVRVGKLPGSNQVQVVDPNTGRPLDISSFTTDKLARLDLFTQQNNVAFNRKESATDYSIFSVDGTTKTQLTQESGVLTFRDQNNFKITDIFELRNAGGAIFNAKIYGASGDNITDDTVAIQNTINAAIAAGGGIVYIPAGNYKIQPQVSGGYNLSINGSNISIVGEGIGLTTLNCHVYGGGDPSGSTPGTNFEVINGAVWRGHGIALLGTASNILIKNLTLNGNAGWQSTLYPVTGIPPPFPADITNGNGWDLTHKGIYIQENQSHDNIYIENVSIHSFRGELVYYGGIGLNKLYINNCDIYDSNGSMVSVTADLTLTNSHVYNGPQLFECSPAIHNIFVSECLFENCQKGPSVVAQSATDANAGKNIISKNIFKNCYQQACYVLGYVQNVDITENQFVDCGQLGESGAIRVENFYGGTPKNIRICDNVLQADQANVWGGIYLEGSISDVLVSRNMIVRSLNAIANNYTFQLSVRYNLTTGADIRVVNNYFDGCYLPGASNANADQIRPFFKDNIYVNTNAFSSVQTTPTLYPQCEIIFGLGGLLNDCDAVTAISTTGYLDGQELTFYPYDPSRPIKMSQTSSSWNFNGPRVNTNQCLKLKYSSSLNKWVEREYYNLINSTVAPSTFDTYPGGRLNTADGTIIKMYGTLDVRPLNPNTAFTSFQDYPNDIPFTVTLSAGQSIVNSSSIILPSGVNFAPTNGGIITVIYHSATSKFYGYNPIAF